MITIGTMTGFSAGEISALRLAEARANQRILTPGFRELGDPAPQIVDEIHVLRLEKYSPVNPFTSAIAYTAGGVIHLNRKCFDVVRYLPRISWWNRMKGVKHTPEQLARAEAEMIAGLSGTLVHEHTHTLGYTHDFYATPERAKSKPYVLGNYIAALF